MTSVFGLLLAGGDASTGAAFAFRLAEAFGDFAGEGASSATAAAASLSSLRLLFLELFAVCVLGEAAFAFFALTPLVAGALALLDAGVVGLDFLALVSGSGAAKL